MKKQIQILIDNGVIEKAENVTEHLKELELYDLKSRSKAIKSYFTENLLRVHFSEDLKTVYVEFVDYGESVDIKERKSIREFLKRIESKTDLSFQFTKFQITEMRQRYNNQ